METVEYGGVMVFAEQNEGAPHRVCFELLAKGRELADTLGAELSCAMLAGKGENADALSARGANKIYLIEDETRFSQPDEPAYAECLAGLIKKAKPGIVLFGATPFGRSLAPRVAALLGAGLTADCTALETDPSDGRLVQIRPAFSGNILARIKSSALPQMATVRHKEFDEAAADTSKKSEIIRISGGAFINNGNAPAFEFIRRLADKRTEITDAEVVVSGGAGLKKASDFGMIKELAALLGGSAGASRAIVENGFVPKEYQVGYSGSRVKPKIYVAAGISGSPQHMAGMKDSETVVAINGDASAPIFKIADVGIVGDLYEVVPKLIKLVTELKNEK